MSRRHTFFDCQGDKLAGSIDEASGTTGLLIVTGGNEVRSGAWDGQSRLSARIAAQGHPVMRFDRRGIGDSEGSNSGYRHSAPDIAAALAAFRNACPHLQRVVGMGNCDAATALMLSAGAGFDALVLSNPWTMEDEGAPPAPAVLRDHYRRRLADPRAILRLLTGKVSLGKLLGSLRHATAEPQKPDTLALEMTRRLDEFSGDARILLAGRDATALAFAASWKRDDPRLRQCAGATHSFVEAEAQAWLETQILEMLER